jgi:SAM-dependent methyltransferase
MTVNRSDTLLPKEAEPESLFHQRNCCPICKCQRVQTLFSAPYTDPRVKGHVQSHYRGQGEVDFQLLQGVDYTLLECEDCSTIFQRMAPVGKMLFYIYDVFIDPEKQKKAELSRLTLDNFHEVSRRLSDLFVAVGKEPKDVRMLDFGFGYGRSARVAVAMGARVYATEISPEKIAFAESIGVTIISEHELADYKFDIIHAEEVFEHLTYPVEVFDRLAAALADDGIIKITVPRQGSIRSLLSKKGFIDWSPLEYDFKRLGYNFYNTVCPLEHVNSYSRKAIKHLAARGGLTVRNSPFGARYMDLDCGSLASLISTGRSWGLRILKELYVAFGPGVRDSGHYILSRKARIKH